jgi:hypothetical protein
MHLDRPLIKQEAEAGRRRLAQEQLQAAKDRSEEEIMAAFGGPDKYEAARNWALKDDRLESDRVTGNQVSSSVQLRR